MQRRLRPVDAENYISAGLMLYRQGEDGMEILVPHERPWNSWLNAYDNLGWSVFGGKRIPRQEYSVEVTSVRCFLEVVGQSEGAPDQDALYSLMADSFVLWFPGGKFALIIAKVPDGTMSELPGAFEESRKDKPSEDSVVLPQGIKKWIKQIEVLEWVPASRLALPEPDFETTNLFENILKVGDFKAWLDGSFDPSTLAGEPNSAFVPTEGGEGKGKGKGSKGGGKRGKDKGGGGKNPWQNQWQGGGGGGFKGMPYGGGGKGMPMMGPGPCMGMQGMQMPYQAMPPPQFAPEQPQQQGGPQFVPGQQHSGDPGNEEAQRQTYGEQLYMMIQPLAPSPYLAQKITGMLLELPVNELMLNLTNQDELYRRVGEALEVLREDGVVG